MDGSIEDNIKLYNKKSFTHVPPSPPAEFIETTSYTLDFASHKFIQVDIHEEKKTMNILTSLH